MHSESGFAEALLPLLRCPSCREGFSFREVARGQYGRAEFGVLQCGCARYPVIDGIPIIQRDRVGMFRHTTNVAQTRGRRPEELVAMLEQGRSDEALIECLCYPRRWQAVERVVGHRLYWTRVAGRVRKAAGRRKFRHEILARRDRISAKDVFAFYYNAASPLGDLLYDYFCLRFGQPRHLAALALLSELPAHEKPVLDVACGAGHLDHYLLKRADPVGVVGCDLNFYQLWIARHWIAPAGWYVCGNAAGAMPFVDDAFSAVFCSDAYHDIPGHQALLPELARCAPGRPVILTHVGNRDVMPNEGQERSVAGYLSEFGVGDVRVFTEDDLVRCYLHRGIALEMPDPPAEALAEAKWLSFVWNLAPGHSTVTSEWPHAVGRLGINPIYHAKPGPDGRIELRFEFPAAWYAYENHAMLAYHPERVEIDRSVLPALLQHRLTPEILKLVASFVIIGMP